MTRKERIFSVLEYFNLWWEKSEVFDRGFDVVDGRRFTKYTSLDSLTLTLPEVDFNYDND